MEVSQLNYLKLEKSSTQIDPVWVYLFIPCLEILCSLMKTNEKIKGLRFFVKYISLSSLWRQLKTFQQRLQMICLMWLIFRSNPNLSKYESAGIGSLKRIKKTLKCNKDLTNFLFLWKRNWT